MANWTEQEIETALQMRNSGASSREIGFRLGRKAHAVRTKFRQLGVAQTREDWLKAHHHDENSEAIADCPTEKQMIEDAVVGSWRLKVAILQAIVRQAA